MAVGSVAFVKQGRELVPAVVLADEGKKLELVFAGGKTRHLATGKLALLSAPLYSGGRQAEQAAQWLADWQARLEEAVAGIDLALLWEIVAEEQADCTLEELYELQFDAPDPLQRAALFVALEQEGAHFKRRQDHYRARPAEEVHALLVADERKQARAQARETLIRTLVAQQHAPLQPGELPSAFEPLVADLRRLALGDEQTPEVRRALRLLEAVPHLPNGKEGAFRALVTLGVFGPDENLALLGSGIPIRWRPAELVAAETMPEPPPLEGEQDLRELPTVTIDEASTDDPDDALSLERCEQGYRLWVHITGVARHVPPDSPLDQAAFTRGASLYLPDGTLPMLPPGCVERMALLAGCERLTLTAQFVISPEGEVLEEQLFPARIRVDRNWSYGEADAAIGAGQSPFAELAELAGLLHDRRQADGAISFTLPELVLRLDGGEVALDRLPSGSPARQLVSEMMILVGARWARFCRDRSIPVVYRRQESPAVELPPADQFPDAHSYFFAIRRNLGAGRLSTQPAPHAGLGLSCYLQATSPLRRYQDLATQRQLLAVISGQQPPYDEAEILRIAAAADNAAREIGRLERERTDHWVMRWLERRVGQSLAARVLGALGPNRYQVLLEACLREHPVHSDRPLEIGQAVQLSLVGLNVFERQVHLKLLSSEKNP